ncbi:galactose-specific lectin nattectin-like [Genypterus blacodes]|uniref:galactose-specific lectin nattectin-like n=1 Tax=Genypterus blacodes TaxID=154954 RepID=UPI003F75DB34
MASFLPLLTLLTVALFASAEGGCPGGWLHYGGRCFQVLSNPLSMPDAESDCMLMGAHLVSYHSRTEMDHVVVHAEGIVGHEPTWTGLHDALKEGRWFHTDGSRFDFSPWAKNEPNNANNEDCVELYHTGHFNDIRCDDVRPYICARSK